MLTIHVLKQSNLSMVAAKSHQQPPAVVYGMSLPQNIQVVTYPCEGHKYVCFLHEASPVYANSAHVMLSIAHDCIQIASLQSDLSKHAVRTAMSQQSDREHHAGELMPMMSFL